MISQRRAAHLCIDTPSLDSLRINPLSPQGMSAAVREATKIVSSRPDAYMLGQFDNPANPQVHYETTGPEIWRDSEGKVDVFVAGVGTGGTLTGVGRFLREKNPRVEIVAVEPAESPVLSGGRPGYHQVR